MQTIRVETEGPIVRVTLDRPDVRNAFNEVMIEELRRAFTSIPEATRAVVLTGAGEVFCAGADVEWMKRSATFTEAENARDAAAMATMLRAVDECPCPVLARVNGHAFGGGSGLAACCDIAVAAETAQFGFTEVRLGLVPANISNFVLPKIGPGAARRYFLTGERFGAADALAMGLIHEVARAEALDARVDELARQILACGPKAVATAKDLIRESLARPRDQAIEQTIRTIARVRVSPEAQEGLQAFLSKRKPRWS